MSSQIPHHTPISRYALYAAPALTHPLHAFVARWLGWDPQTGQAFPPKGAAGLTADRIAALTAEPRRYGLHATLKPPFRLADGQTEAALFAALQDFAAARSALPLIKLQLASLSGFLALRPSGDDTALRALADACVMAFDGFRAPAGESEIAKRRAAGLTERQDAYLLRWGYPYVLEDFRPHFTLTGRIRDAAEREALLGYLDRQLAPFLAEPLAIAELCLFGQEADANFRILARFPFRV